MDSHRRKFVIFYYRYQLMALHGSILIGSGVARSRSPFQFHDRIHTVHLDLSSRWFFFGFVFPRLCLTILSSMSWSVIGCCRITDALIGCLLMNVLTTMSTQQSSLVSMPSLSWWRPSCYGFWLTISSFKRGMWLRNSSFKPETWIKFFNPHAAPGQSRGHCSLLCIRYYNNLVYY